MVSQKNKKTKNKNKTKQHKNEPMKCVQLTYCFICGFSLDCVSFVMVHYDNDGCKY